jgi:hypothetical protein
MPRLTPAQEERFQHLVWTSLVQSAVTADKTGRIDIRLLREAEKFVDRNIHSMWNHSVFLDVVGEDPPNPDKEEGRQDRGHQFDEDDTEKAKIYCKRDDDGVELYDEPDYIEYWKNSTLPEILIDEPWDNTKVILYGVENGVPWDGSLENLGYIGGGNLTGIGFMYHHRNCTHCPYGDVDLYDPMNQPPPDTPSLPPRGTADPHW